MEFRGQTHAAQNVLNQKAKDKKYKVLNYGQGYFRHLKKKIQIANKIILPFGQNIRHLG